MFERNEEPLVEIIAVLNKTRFSELQAPAGKIFTLKDSRGFFLVNWRDGRPVVTTLASSALRFSDLRLCCVYGRFLEQTGPVGTAPVFVHQMDLPRPNIRILGFESGRAERALPKFGRLW